MKKRFLPLCLALLVLYCLLFPARMAHAVSEGLALWYRSILPTLLPFCIFSNIIIHSGVYDRVFEKLHPIFRHIYPVRAPLVYPMVAGFLFGFPLGSKICADLYDSGRISSREAQTVSCISNNFGPAFLYNYVVAGLLGDKVHTWIMFACFYLPPLLLGRIIISTNKMIHDQHDHFFRVNHPCNNRTLHSAQQLHRNYFFHSNHMVAKKSNGKNGESIRHLHETISKNPKKPPSESPISMKILDAGIMDGFTTMLKLAGYILLSALLADILKSMPISNPFLAAIGTGSIEITNGISRIATLNVGLRTKAILAIGIVNFGGLSGFLQTYSMMKSADFQSGRYLIFKIACSLLGILLFLTLQSKLLF